MSSRRKFIRNTFLAGAGISIAPIIGNIDASAASVTEQIQSGGKPTFSLPPLPYGFDELEPYIDTETMQIHYGKHHAAYVSNLNKAVESLDSFPHKLEEVFKNMEKWPAAVRNNGGGHWNHSFFWDLLRKGKENNAPTGKLAEAIVRDFGSFDELKKQFKTTATGQFGSGWAWLIIQSDGKLAVTGTPNQDNPLMSVATKQGRPILGLDVWEHAYYLKYQNKRADYIDNFWYVVNWEKANSLFLKK